MAKRTAEERIGDFLRFGSRLGLERMTELMHRLGDPQDGLKVFHVAGTNGKGSTARYIYESLIEAGYHAGLYTSPFLEKFNERIEADRKAISDEDLEECTDIVLEKVDEMIADGLESPTEFEVVTAVAFVYYNKIKCDTAVLEVGLGGRGDSTNIIKSPAVSVIASISYDHMDRLGSTIPEIAGEKAGIIKAGCPVVVSTEREDALEVFRNKASELGAPLYDARSLASYDIKELRADGAEFDYHLDKTESTEEVELKDLQISMGGEHQVINACEAVTALLIQDQFNVTEDAIRRGLRRAKQPGRFEIMYSPSFDCYSDCYSDWGQAPIGATPPIGACPQSERQSEHHHSGPWVLLDGAHNQDAARRLRDAVDEFFPGKSVLFVCGVLRDKDLSAILDEFVEIGDDFIATEPENDRKLTAYELAKAIHERGKLVYEVPKPEDATALAMSIAKGYDVVLFTGSLYLIGKIRTLLRNGYLKPGDICFDRPESDDDSLTVGIEEDD